MQGSGGKTCDEAGLLTPSADPLAARQSGLKSSSSSGFPIARQCTKVAWTKKN